MKSGLHKSTRALIAVSSDNAQNQQRLCGQIIETLQAAGYDRIKSDGTIGNWISPNGDYPDIILQKYSNDVCECLRSFFKLGKSITNQEIQNGISLDQASGSYILLNTAGEIQEKFISLLESAVSPNRTTIIRQTFIDTEIINPKRDFALSFEKDCSILFQRLFYITDPLSLFFACASFSLENKLKRQNSKVKISNYADIQISIKSRPFIRMRNHSTINDEAIMDSYIESKGGSLSLTDADADAGARNAIGEIRFNDASVKSFNLWFDNQCKKQNSTTGTSTLLILKQNISHLYRNDRRQLFTTIAKVIGTYLVDTGLMDDAVISLVGSCVKRDKISNSEYPKDIDILIYVPKLDNTIYEIILEEVGGFLELIHEIGNLSFNIDTSIGPAFSEVNVDIPLHLLIHDNSTINKIPIKTKNDWIDYRIDIHQRLDSIIFHEDLDISEITTGRFGAKEIYDKSLKYTYRWNFERSSSQLEKQNIPEEFLTNEYYRTLFIYGIKWTIRNYKKYDHTLNSSKIIDELSKKYLEELPMRDMTEIYSFVENNSGEIDDLPSNEILQKFLGGLIDLIENTG